MHGYRVLGVALALLVGLASSNSGEGHHTKPKGRVCRVLLEDPHRCSGTPPLKEVRTIEPSRTRADDRDPHYVSTVLSSSSGSQIVLVRELARPDLESAPEPSYPWRMTPHARLTAPCSILG
jgi:hypothetical protein